MAIVSIIFGSVIALILTGVAAMLGTFSAWGLFGFYLIAAFTTATLMIAASLAYRHFCKAPPKD